MDDKKMKTHFGEKLKEGIPVKDIELFARKHTVEGFFILAILVAIISSSIGFFTGAGWSVFLGGVGAIISISFPETIAKVEEMYFMQAARPEKSIQITVGLVLLVLAIFIPFIIFIQVGLLCGIAFHHFARMPASEELEKSKSHTEKEHH